MRRMSNCPHVSVIGEHQSWEEIKKKHELQECHTCQAQPPNLWLCLVGNCNYIGCGESSKDHSACHAEEFKHCLTINLTTMRIWCYSCENEVLVEHNNPPLLLNERTYQVMHRPDGSTDSSPQRSAFEAEDSESDMDDDTIKPRGLTGLQNLGNTCYMNAALQALSNCPPLTRFFLDCSGFVRPDRNPMLSRHYLRLISEIWHKKRPSYVVPSGIANGIKAVHPMFRGYTQQDTQEFLRCFMDQLHEELKQPLVDWDSGNNTSLITSTAAAAMLCHEALPSSGGPSDKPYMNDHDRQSSIDSSSSQSDYETCDSAHSSERGGTPEVNLSGDEGSDTNEQTQLNNKENHFVNNNNNNTGQENNESDTNINNFLNNQKEAIIANATEQIESLKSSSISSPALNKESFVQANLTNCTKEMKDSANLRCKQTEALMAGGTNASTTGQDEGSTLANMATSNNTATEFQDAISDEEHSSKVKSMPSTLRGKSQTQQQSSKLSASDKAKRPVTHQSVISDIFDGKLLSSVQCLTCERISTTKETFQDLSLPIPSKDHLHMLHASQSSTSKGGACGEVNQGWIASMLTWIKSWFVGPTITLQDCLAAFFSADELKGDNMYSCDKCKKLRNGMKYSKVMRLPEILCIHLKRFRHEFYSSKISTYVSFPLEGLNMKSYLHKDCQDEVTSYDLMSVICHHGTAGGGHYTAYCLNYINDQWYEFDDQYVTEVDFQQVMSSSAYVLFYRKQNDHMMPMRESAMSLMEEPEPSLLQFYVSKQWINRFNTFAEPGPITNQDFLCPHGGVPPTKMGHVEQLVVLLHQPVWQYLHERFGGGPACTHLIDCKTCEMELENLKNRQRTEMESFIQLNEKFQAEDDPAIIYAISMAWFKDWENFVKAKTDTPPDPIDNSRITVLKNGQPFLKSGSDYGQLSREMWQFLHGIYGGGPELIQRQHPAILPAATPASGSGGSQPPASVPAAAPAPAPAPAPTIPDGCVNMDSSACSSVDKTEEEDESTSYNSVPMSANVIDTRL